MFVCDALDDRDERREIVNVQGVCINRFGEDARLLAQLRSDFPDLVSGRRLAHINAPSESSLRRYCVIPDEQAAYFYLSLRRPG